MKDTVFLQADVQSSFAVGEYARLPAGTRERLRVPEEALHLWDLVVAVCGVFATTHEDRPWQDRLNEVLELRQDVVDVDWFEDLARQLNELSEHPERGIGFVDRLANTAYISFIERSVGSAAFHRLREAVHRDVQVVAGVAQKLATWAMPYAVAMQDALAMTRANEMPNGQGRTLLGFIVGAERGLAELAAGRFEIASVSSAFQPEAPVTAEELTAIHQEVRGDVFAQSLDIANKLGAVAIRKLKGASEVLAVSSDGVSQAATSLIELVNRLLRDAFTDDEVLAWIAENRTGGTDLTYRTPNGTVRPTKRGQALCFVAIGQPLTPELEPLISMLADVLVDVRNELEALKHADKGTPDEVDRVAALASAIHGFLLLAVGVTWRSFPAEARAKMLGRLEPIAGESQPNGTVEENDGALSA